MTHEELQALGLDVSAEAHARLERFVIRLLVENEKLNLTGARTPAAAWHHVLDSLALLPWLEAFPAKALIDVGTGGGLPGVPLACVFPDVAVTLNDATAKKVAALERMLADLALPNIRCVRGRAEFLGHTSAHREQYDVVTARAVGGLSLLLEYAAGFLRAGGVAWFYKTADVETEQRAARSAARACRLEPDELLPYRLPGEDRDRVLASYVKTAPLPPDLPREPGRARKRPL